MEQKSNERCDEVDTGTAAKDTRSNSKVYPHVLPRIDQEYYQAEIPRAYTLPIPVEAAITDWYESTKEVHSTDKNEETKKNFISFARNIFDRAYHSDSLWTRDLASFPLHSDENVLEFLAMHGYEINKAKFYFCAILSGGKEAMHLRRIRKDFRKLPSTGVNEKLQYLFDKQNSEQTLHGFYYSAPSHRRTYIMETTLPHIPRCVIEDEGDGMEQVAAITNGRVVATPVDPTSSGVAEGDGDGGEISSRLRSKPTSVTGPCSRSGSQRNGGRSSGGRGNSRKKNGSYKDDSPTAIPAATSSESAGPTTDASFGAGDSRDMYGLAIGNALPLPASVLGQNVDSKHRSKADKQEMKKKWLAIHKKTTGLIAATKSAYGGYSRPSYETLHQLLLDAYEAMPMPSDILLDEPVFKSLRDSTLELIESYLCCREWMADVYDSLCPIANVDIDFNALTALMSEGECMPFRCVLEENQLKRALKDLEQLGSEGSRILGICSNDKIITESEKVSIYDLNKTLCIMLPYKALSNIPGLTQTNMDSLKALQKRAWDLNERIDNLIHRASMPRLKKFQQKRVTFAEVHELLLEASAFPVLLFGIPDLKSIAKVSENWHQEALGVCGNDSAVVSLNKLEALIAEGEKLPVEYTEELDSLRDRRGHAKQWLEKFRKRITTTGRFTRKSESSSASTGGSGSGTGVNTSTSEKMGLADMKKMVEQGEQLYEERKNKELSRAADMVDAAEEWVSRVTEFMEAGDAVDIEELQHLLDETEGMPVAMPEADLLRTHIEALQWARRAKPALERGTSKYATLQRLHREILKIRAAVAPELSSRIKVKLPEEVKLGDIVETVQKWQAQLKKKFQGNSLRPGVSLAPVQQLLHTAEALPVDMDVETKYIRSVVHSAAEWIATHSAALIGLGISITSIDLTVSPEMCSSIMDDGHSLGCVSNPEDTELHVLPTMDNHKDNHDDVIKLEKFDVEHTSIVTYADIKLLVESASSFVVKFPELTAARERFDAVNEWLDDVNMKCPQKTTRKHINSAVCDINKPYDLSTVCQVSQLLELRGVAEELQVDLPDQLRRIDEMVASAMHWEEISKTSFSTTLQHIDSMVQTYRNCTQQGCPQDVRFPFLQGTNATLDGLIGDTSCIALDENDTTVITRCAFGQYVENDTLSSTTTVNVSGSHWNDLEAVVFPAVVALLQDGERIGAVSDFGETLCMCRSVLRLIAAMTGKLAKDQWGDNSIESILTHIKEARMLVSLERSQKEFDAYYTGTLLQHSSVEISPSHMEFLSSDHATFSSIAEDSERSKKLRRRDTVDWAVRLSKDGQIEDSTTVALNSPNVGGAPVGLSRRGSKSSTSLADDATSETGSVLSTTDHDKKSSSTGGRKSADRLSSSGDSAMLTASDGSTATSRPVGGKKKREKRNQPDSDRDAGDKVKHISKRPRGNHTPSETGDDDGEGHTSAFGVDGFDMIDIKEEPERFLMPPSHDELVRSDSKNIQTTPSEAIPSSLAALVDYWIRWMWLLYIRLQEVDLWRQKTDTLIISTSLDRRGGGVHGKKLKTSDDVMRAKNWANIVLKASDAEPLCQLLEWANRRSIKSSRRCYIEARYAKSNAWVEVMEAILSGKKKLSLEDTVAFVKTGEKVLLFPENDSIQILRDHIKKARNWTLKLERLERGATSVMALEDLLPEADKFLIDMTPTIDSIMQITKVYCFCRQPFHGIMVGCDTEGCEDWYHIGCIGMTKAQADKVDTYSCLRCNIKASFAASYTGACKLVNSWMRPAETAKAMDNKRQRILKRMEKDVMEEETLRVELKACKAKKVELNKRNATLLASVSSAAAIMATSLLLGNTEPLTGDKDAPAATTGGVGQIEHCDDSMEEVVENMGPQAQGQAGSTVVVETGSTAKGLVGGVAEESTVSTDEAAAISAKLHQLDLRISELRGQLNPIRTRLSRAVSDDDELRTFFALPIEGRYHVTEWMQAMQRILWPSCSEEEELGRPTAVGLSPGIVNHLQAARTLGIHEFADVQRLEEYFKWMNWCYQCLHLLRAPPKASELKELVGKAKQCRTADDKIVKTVGQILTRIQSWKAKARKWLGAPPTSNREKFNRTVDVHKAKQLLHEGSAIPCVSRLKDVLKNAISTVTDPFPADGTDGATGGRKAKGKDKDTAGATGNLTCVVDEYLPYSSDEELDVNAPKYTSIAGFYLAPSPNYLWPQTGETALVLEPYPTTFRHVFVDPNDLLNTPLASTSEAPAAPIPAPGGSEGTGSDAWGVSGRGGSLLSTSVKKRKKVVDNAVSSTATTTTAAAIAAPTLVPVGAVTADGDSIDKRPAIATIDVSSSLSAAQAKTPVPIQSPSVTHTSTAPALIMTAPRSPEEAMGHFSVPVGPGVSAPDTATVTLDDRTSVSGTVNGRQYTVDGGAAGVDSEVREDSSPVSKRMRTDIHEGLGEYAPPAPGYMIQSTGHADEGTSTDRAASTSTTTALQSGPSVFNQSDEKC